MSNSVSFRIGPKPEPRAPKGEYTQIIEAARELIGTDNCIEFNLNGRNSHAIRTNLGASRQLRSDEKMHVSIHDGVVKVWITRKPNS